MSTFPGPLPEIPNVCIDKFDHQAAWKCTAFFLSHAHSGRIFTSIFCFIIIQPTQSFNLADHMAGLDSTEFKACLQTRQGVELYMSSVTWTLLENWVKDKYSFLKDHVHQLRNGEPTKILLKNENRSNHEIEVTTFDAGHCLGSVM
jgi:hypothetical protein